MLGSLEKYIAPVVTALIAATGPSQQPLYTFVGDVAGDRYGASVRSAGDVNGDTFDDVIVGAPDADNAGTDAGRVRVLSGLDGSVLYTFDGDDADDRMGLSVSGAGDVNGDGFADVVAGAPGDDDNGSASGSARVFSGLDGAVLYTFFGDSVQDEFGASVSGAGDVNMDGYDDVIVGAPGDDNTGANSGSARVLSGKDGVVLYTLNGIDALDRLGYSVSGAGDVNGDSFFDFVVGAPWSDVSGTASGRVLVLSGIDGSVLHEINGADANDHYGWSVSGGGDVDGDGTPDVVVGVPLDDGNGTDSGCVEVLSGTDASVLYTLVGSAAFDHFGWSVGADGDLDGDGNADVVVGAPLHDPSGVADAGRVTVYSGATGGLMLSFDGTASLRKLGWAAGVAGDLDGDGFDDVIMGGPEDDPLALGAGRVQTFTSKPYDALADVLTLNPAVAGGRFGSAITPVGDIDLDGVDDYAIGAPWDLGTLGVVRVFSGADHTVLRTFIGTGLNILWGSRIAPAGDFDKDGVPDVVIGAQHDNTIFPTSGATLVFSGRTSGILLTVFGNQPGSHLGSAVGALRDVDGDSVIDVYSGLARQYSDDGAIWISSGNTGALIREIRGETQSWFGWSSATLGDINNDGFDDFVVGGPGITYALPGHAKVLSGRDGSTIYRFGGLNDFDEFGLVCAAAGDVNADGVMDIIVGGHLHDPGEMMDAGMARVFSGADGSILYDLAGTTSGDEYGGGVGGAGDVNGDGYDDFLVGAIGASPGGLNRAGSTYLYSGVDGSLLQQMDGTIVDGEFGRYPTGVGDINGDTYADAIIGAPLADAPGNESGVARVFESQTLASPGMALTFGVGCETSTGNLPRIEYAGRPALGELFRFGLTSSASQSTVALGFDFARQNIPMGIAGAPGCTLFALPQLAVPANTNVLGEVGLGIRMPSDPATVGGSLYLQWVVVDPAANTLGLVFSDGGRITIGKP